MLQGAAETSDRAGKEELLVSARSTVELLKAAELRDYFRDECVDVLQTKIAKVEEVSEGALVVYPIVGRLEPKTEVCGSGSC